MVCHKIHPSFSLDHCALTVFLIAFVTIATGAWAVTCTTESAIPQAARASLEQTAGNYLRQASAGDVSSLRASAIPSLVTNFAGIEAAVSQNQGALKGGQGKITGTYLLDAEGTAVIPRAEFFCGIFNSPDRTTFIIPSLQPGHYALVTQEVNGATPVYFSVVLNQQQGMWKLAGLTIKPMKIGGRDAKYFLDKAREFQAQGQGILAWLYFVQAWELDAPVNFMYNVSRDKIADETQKAKPPDLPSQERPLQLSSAGKSFAVTDLFSEPVEMEGRATLYLILKYKATTDISNTGETFQANRDAIQALVARYPGIKNAFDGIVVRAVASSGTDYGTMLAMKDVQLGR